MPRVDRELLIAIDRLLREYEDVVDDARVQGLVTEKTANTYVLHSRNFVRWMKGDFVPGVRNMRGPSR